MVQGTSTKVTGQESTFHHRSGATQPSHHGGSRSPEPPISVPFPAPPLPTTAVPRPQPHSSHPRPLSTGGQVRHKSLPGIFLALRGPIPAPGLHDLPPSSSGTSPLHSPCSTIFHHDYLFLQPQGLCTSRSGPQLLPHGLPWLAPVCRSSQLSPPLLLPTPGSATHHCSMHCYPPIILMCLWMDPTYHH